MPRTAHELLPGESFFGDIRGSYRTADGKAQIDWQVESGRFSATGNYDGGCGQCLDEIRSTYPEDIAVQNLCQLWQLWHLRNLPTATIETLRADAALYQNTNESFCDFQAREFLTRNGLKFRATLSDTKAPAWDHGGEHGHHYRVTISRKGAKSRLVFDFWGSIADARAGITEERPYSVLACLSSDAFCPDTFADFCGEYGFDADSIKALQLFRRCSGFAKRIRAFFTESELAELSEIR